MCRKDMYLKWIKMHTSVNLFLFMSSNVLCQINYLLLSERWFVLIINSSDYKVLKKMTFELLCKSDLGPHPITIEGPFFQ